MTHACYLAIFDFSQLCRSFYPSGSSSLKMFMPLYLASVPSTDIRLERKIGK